MHLSSQGREQTIVVQRTNDGDRNLAIVARLGMSPFLFGRPHVRSCEFPQERRKAGAECNSRRRLVMALSSARTQEKLSLLSLLTRGGTQRETGLVQNHSLYCPIRPMSYTGFRVRRKSPVLATPCGRGRRGGTRRGSGIASRRSSRGSRAGRASGVTVVYLVSRWVRAAVRQGHRARTPLQSPKSR
jgi:hypothetical protein